MMEHKWNSKSEKTIFKFVMTYLIAILVVKTITFLHTSFLLSLIKS